MKASRYPDRSTCVMRRLWFCRKIRLSFTIDDRWSKQAMDFERIKQVQTVGRRELIARMTVRLYMTLFDACRQPTIRYRSTSAVLNA